MDGCLFWSDCEMMTVDFRLQDGDKMQYKDDHEILLKSLNYSAQISCVVIKKWQQRFSQGIMKLCLVISIFHYIDRSILLNFHPGLK